MKLKIDVTEEDIATGFRSDSCSCPVARAINRARPNSFASVAPRQVMVDSLNSDCLRRKCSMPLEATKFVLWFDSYDYRAKPFSFELEIPEEVTA